jgi:2-polyprenyl-3-methyl-5-hydroxy-6-metoxy-1,4-benzoquinol methylase
VNPIETTKALIQDGPVLGDRPAHLLQSSNVDDIKGSWEQPLIEGYMRELPAKKLNAQDVLRHISGLFRRRGTLLDIGCGCGAFLSVACQEGWDCYGIEPLVMHAIFARAHFGLRIVTDTLCDDTYPPEFFDVVTAFQVFEHLLHPDQEIEKIRRILKTGGLLVIEVPNIDTITVKLLGSKHRHFVQDHVSLFSAKTLIFLLNRIGFEIRELYYPARVMSVRHFVSWLEKYNDMFRNHLHRNIPQSFLGKLIRINLRDIVTVIAEKSEA